MRKYTIIFFIILMVLATTLIMTSCGNNGDGTAVVSYYGVTATSPQVAGIGWSETVTAKDVYGNDVVVASAKTLTSSSGSGNVVFYTDGTHTEVAASYTIGVGTSSVTIYPLSTVAEVVTLTVTDGALKSGTSGNITVDPAAADRVVITDAGDDFVTGGTTTLTVQVEDQYGNHIPTDNTTVITFDPSALGVGGTISDVVMGTGDGSYWVVGASEAVTVAGGVAGVELTNEVAETFEVSISSVLPNNPANDSISVTPKRIASDAQADDNFGLSVSISGDYAIVGAYNEDGLGTNLGAAYIFNRNQDGADQWGEVTKLTASDAQDNDYFGYAVSISGDYAIIGAYGEDGGGTDRGAAYIFYRNQGGADQWGEVKKLTASDKEDFDMFGYAVSISGDYAIIGAYGEDGLGNYLGAAYIFYRNQGGADQWGEVKKLTASDKEDFDMFGYAVSISGDYAIVGACYENGLGSNGAAYIFYRNQGGVDQWGEVTKLTASDKESSDMFYAVSISGDYAIVGAYGKDGGVTEPDRGVAYIFYRDQGGADQWGEVTKLTASDAQDSDLFGYAVSISGDYAIIGAYGEDGLGSDRGAAYIFYRNQDGADQWGEVTKLTASDADDSDLFGCSVSISGDYAIVGAYGEDSGASNGGALYIY